MKKKPLFYVALALCLALALFSGYKVVTISAEYRAGDAAAAELQQFIVLDPTQPESPATCPPTQAPEYSDETAPTEIPEPTEDPYPYPEVDFESLQGINPDVVGWILIEGTNINYPIVRGADNSRYLSVMADGRRNAAGSIFMDYRCASDFSDSHTVIYGHNMRNGSMFHNIRLYSRPEFLAEHPMGIILTPEKNFRFEVIGGYVAKPDSEAWRLDFNSGEEFAGWLDASMAASEFDSGIVPTAEDRIITLSTCSYEFNNARYVLICRVIC